MARIHVLAALVLVLLGAVGVASAVVVGEPVLDATLQTDAVSPGQDTTLSLTILNNGSVTVGSVQNPQLTQRVTTARGLKVIVDRHDEAPIAVRTGTLAVGQLPEGGAATLEVPITVDDDVAPGDYRLPLNVSYRHTSRIEDSGVEQTESVSRTLNVTLTVEESPRFAVRNVSSALRVAATETVSVTVENVGGETAYDAALTLESPNADLAFGGASSATRFVGTWAPGEVRTVDFEVTAAESAGAQDYPLHLSAAYEDRDGVPGESETRRISVRPAPEQTFSVANVSSTLAVGAEGRLVGTVTNTGTSPVRNVVVVFETDRETITPLETEFPVGDLAPGEGAEFDFPIEVTDEAESGPRQFAVRTRYRTAGGTLVEGDSIDVRADVGSKRPAFEVALRNATVEPGGRTELAVTVTNTGDETYSEVSAKLFAESPLSTSDDEAFVERLEPGESDEVVFAVSADPSALSKRYPVSIDFRYDDADGDTRTSDTYRRAVTVVEPEDDGGPPLLLIGAGLLVVLVAGALYYRSRG